ncbi:MAG: IS630 family transposase [Deltaproteobacteria bacterium]|nr:IS630 family transposase [Deltaproteobacteria bacterium]
MRPAGSAKWLSDRRRKSAGPFSTKGNNLHETARLVRCDPSSVLRWRDQRAVEGESVFEVKRASGRPRKLTEKQRSRLTTMLLKGAMKHGYPTDLWTTQRIADLIEKRFGVSYHRDHIGRLMASLGWSHQKPDRRAKERDNAAIERWTREEWPRVKKNAEDLGAHLVFIDESGFCLIPPVRKTWAPKGGKRRS